MTSSPRTGLTLPIDHDAVDPEPLVAQAARPAQSAAISPFKASPAQRRPSRNQGAVRSDRADRPPPDDDRRRELIDLQDGVISRRQLRESGFLDHDIRRLVRRKELAPVFPGVYVAHTGDTTWRQRAWAAVLATWPAALCHDSALRAVEGPGRRDRAADAPIHVAVNRTRTLAAPPGVVVHALARIDDRVQWNTSPPRERVEDALLDLAAEAPTEERAIVRLADAVQARITTADRLVDALSARPRIARRAFLTDLLSDIRDGTCSLLEHRYLTDVERAHGLPRPERQARLHMDRPSMSDVDYPAYGLTIELDGRLFHDNVTARTRDLARDLDDAVEADRATVRIGWGQVVDACTTAAKIAVLLQRGGWRGAPTDCAACRRAA